MLKTKAPAVYIVGGYFNSIEQMDTKLVVVRSVKDLEKYKLKNPKWEDKIGAHLLLDCKKHKQDFDQLSSLRVGHTFMFGGMNFVIRKVIEQDERK